MQGDSRGGIHTYLADRKFKEICRWQLNVSEPGLSRLCQVTEVGVPLTSLVTPTVSAGLKWALVSYLSVCYDPIESFLDPVSAWLSPEVRSGRLRKEVNIGPCH